MPIENGENRDREGKFVAGNTASVGKGRPKGGQSIPDLLKRIGEEGIPIELQQKVKLAFDDVDTKDMTFMEAVMRTTMMYAISGKPWAVQFIADRLEGRPLQAMSIESHEPIQLIKTGNKTLDDM